MIIAALLHPNISSNAIEPYRNAHAGVRIRENLRGPDPFDAALIFGGDGTVHRHLSDLCNRPVPMLVVPRGSGNDFAKALGIHNQATALRAWRRFCERGDNVRSI